MTIVTIFCDWPPDGCSVKNNSFRLVLVSNDKFGLVQEFGDTADRYPYLKRVLYGLRN